MAFSKELYRKEILIDNASIDAVSQDIYQFFMSVYEKKSMKKGRSNALRLRLEVEEALLKLSNWSGDGNCSQKTCSISIHKKFLKYIICIEMAGERTDIYNTASTDEFSAILEAYSLEGMSRKQYYNNGINVVIISAVIQKVGPLAHTMIAIIAAILISNLLLLLPGDAAAMTLELLVAPLLSTILGIFSLVAMTMIFFNITMGICSMESIEFVKRTGAAIMRYAFLRNFITIFVSTIFFAGAYGILDRNLSGSFTVMRDLSNLIFAIIPENIISPFHSKNALQIMLLGLFCGIVMLLLGDRIRDLKKVVSQLNLFSIKAVSLICKLTPLMIFLSISKLILSDSIHMVLDCWQLLLMQIILCAFYAIGTFFYISKKSKIPMRELILNAIPIMLTGFSTSSSTACLQQNLDLLKDKYHVEDRKIDVIQPLFQLFFEPTKAVSLVAYSIFACKEYDIQLSVIQLIVFIFIVLLLVASAPPVSGGLLAVLSILFTSLGLPLDAILLAVGVDAIVGMVRCGFKQSYYAAEIMMVSRKI